MRTVSSVPTTFSYISSKNNLYNTDNGHKISALGSKFIRPFGHYREISDLGLETCLQISIFPDLAIIIF